VERLGDPGDERTFAALLVAQSDPHPWVRAAAATALGARGGSRSLEALAAMLADTDPDVVSAAARAMATLQPDGPRSDARAAADLGERAGRALAIAYGRADSRGRQDIAAALHARGKSLREAVEAESAWLWEQNVREFRTGSLSGRSGAAEELGRSGRTEAIRLLLPVVAEAAADPGLAAAAARGLGWAGDRSAIEALEGALRNRPAPVTEASVWALGAIGDPDTADLLGEVGHRGSSRIGLAAVAALDAFPPAQAVGVSLCEIAVRSSEPAVAERAAQSARERSAECPERALAQRIGRGGQETLSALAALGALGLPADRLRAPAERAVPLLAPPAEPRIRAGAARALGRAPWPASVPALQKRLAALGDRDAAELAEVAVALAALQPDGSSPLLARLSASEDPVLRAAAARGFGAIRQPTAVAPLAALSRDSEPAVRLAAYEALGPLGSPGLAALVAALPVRAGDPQDLEAIVRALGATGEPAAVPSLAGLLGGAHAASAAASLGRLGTPGAVAPLVALLESGAKGGRIEAVEALGQLGSAEAGDALSRQLLSDRPAVRAAAARALGRIRHEAASPHLEALRSDYYVDVRKAALEALARLPVRGVKKP
jgi:HEAT repeat protein